MGKSPLKRRRNQAINELQNLKYLPRRYLRGMIRCILDIAQLLKLIIHIQQISNYYSMFSAPLNAKLCLKTALLRMQVAHPEKLKLGVLIKFTIFQKYLQFKISLSDHVGFGPDRQTTAAVGILKCVRCEESHEYNRISKVNLYERWIFHVNR